MDTYRTTSPRVRGRAAATMVAGLLLLGLGSAPQALATPHVPERVHGARPVAWLTVGQLRREAAADRAQHLRWSGGTTVTWLGDDGLHAEALADRAQHLAATG